MLQNAGTSRDLAGIRSQYRSTLLQAAFAYRLKQICDDDPTFEPSAENGRLGDLSAIHRGVSYAFECYAPKAKLKISPTDEVNWLTRKAIDEVRGMEEVVAIGIALTKMPSASERKYLVRVVARLAAEVAGEGLRPGRPAPVRLHEANCGSVSVGLSFETAAGQDYAGMLHPAFPRLSDKPSMLTGLRVARRREIASLDPIGQPGTGGSHVAVWLPTDRPDLRAHVDEELLALIPKIKKKLAQTKVGESRRVMIVDTWAASYADSGVSDDTRRELERQVFGGHANVGGVLFVHRHYNNDIKRYRYTMIDVEPDATPSGIVGILARREPETLIPPPEFPEPGVRNAGQK